MLFPHSGFECFLQAPPVQKLNIFPFRTLFIEQIRTGGTTVFNRYVNTGGLAQFLSIFDSEICSVTVDNLTRSDSPADETISTPKRKRNRKKSEGPFERKLSEFYKKLESEGYGSGPSKMKIQLER